MQLKHIHPPLALALALAFMWADRVHADVVDGPMSDVVDLADAGPAGMDGTGDDVRADRRLDGGPVTDDASPSLPSEAGAAGTDAPDTISAPDGMPGDTTAEDDAGPSPADAVPSNMTTSLTDPSSIAGFCPVRPLWPDPTLVAPSSPASPEDFARPATAPEPFWLLPDLTPKGAPPGLFDAFTPVPPASSDDKASRPDLSTGEAIKAILGLLALLALAYMAGHPAVQRVEQRLRISQIVTAGFPFVIFGAIASSDSVGVLSPPVMEAIAPLLPLGLGWIGFAIGIRYTLSRPTIDTAPIVEAFVLTTFIPFGLIVGAASIGLAIAGGGIDEGAAFLRDALILATAGAMTAKSLPTLIERLGAGSVQVERMRHIIQLEEIAAFGGLILVAAFFRPDDSDVGWHLPSVGWIFVTIGIGSALGAVTFASLGTISGATETMVVMLGSICFAAGISSYLRLSPIVVCFLAGVLLSNLPGQWKQQVREAVARLERPIYLIFLLIAGALWPIGDWQGWVLMVLFVAARTGGRFISVRVLSSRQPGVFSPLEQRNLAASPMGALSIAIVMTAQDLYSGPSVAWIVTAILGGAIVTEFITQVSAFATQKLFPDYSDEVDASMPAPSRMHGDATNASGPDADRETPETTLESIPSPIPLPVDPAVDVDVDFAVAAVIIDVATAEVPATETIADSDDDITPASTLPAENVPPPLPAPTSTGKDA